VPSAVPKNNEEELRRRLDDVQRETDAVCDIACADQYNETLHQRLRKLRDSVSWLVKLHFG
jgi:tetrahydromethanopterin S-methyltransferase subunit G